jgi:hypothetical protein
MLGVGGGMSTIPIAGIAIGAAAGLSLIGLVVIFLIRV